MISNRKHNKDPWVRVYDVKEAAKHLKGYTIYKVISKVFPRNSVEAITEVIVWKRYSDFKKLNKSLSSIHQSLHLKGTFPKFIQAKYFGRFDEDVIEERKKCCLDLLRFVSEYPALYNSQMFVKFFEDGCESFVEEDKLILGKNTLQPEKDNFDENSFQPDQSIDSNTICLDGTWKHHQSAEDISLNSDCSDWTIPGGGEGGGGEQGEDREGGNNSIKSSGALSSDDLSFFDPLSSNVNQFGNLSNSWLLSAIESCTLETNNVQQTEERSECLTSSNSFQFPAPFANEDIERPSDYPKPVTLLKGKSSSIKVQSDIEDNSSSSSIKHSPLENIFKNESPKRNSLLLEGGETKEDDEEEESLRKTFPNQLIRFKSSENVDSYLIEAAEIISQGKSYEAESNFPFAFSKYKDAVGVLLNGVQGESDKERREAVRRKIAQYLSHAETICAEHLRDTLSQNNLRWAAAVSFSSSGYGGVGESATPSHSSFDSIVIKTSLHGSLEELSRYRVLGIINRLLIVLDLSTNQTRVIKCLQKSSSPVLGSPNIVPQFIPFMVEILRVYETCDCLYLLLRHASGGQLWDYVSSYLERSPISPSGLVPSLSPTSASSSSKGETLPGNKNVYSGKILHEMKFQDGKENEFVEEARDAASIDSDLKASEECSSSYVELFTEYAASVHLDETTTIAECSIQPTEKTSDVLCDKQKEDLLGHIIRSSFPEKDSTFDVEVKVEVLEEKNLPAGVEVDNLIRYSKALLQTVDQTLKATTLDKEGQEKEKYIKLGNFKQSSSDDDNNKNTKHKRESREERTVRRSSLGHKQKSVGIPVSLNRTSTPCLKEMSRRLSCSMGSLEIRSSTQRVRQLSEIFHQLDASRRSTSSSFLRLPESCVRIWAAEIVTALSQLHLLGIVWQDLHPNNILLGERGHILLTYMCRWNCVDRHFYPKAKMNMYSAPEVGGIFPVTPACDWWSLGALLYELMTGRSLVQSHPTGITSHTRLSLPSHLSLEAKDFLDKLLRYHAPERLGAGTQGIESIKYHPFFAGVNWTQLETI